MPTYGLLWPTYAKEWDRCVIVPKRQAEVNATVVRLLRNKSRYQTIEKLTQVPWYLVAALHEREGSGNFNTQLAQGDPLHRRSHNEPISGPFKTFEASAVWALAHDSLSKQHDWRIEKILYYAELWNGWGYHNRGVPSPYVFGATNVQRSGKYVADHVWSSRAWDSQLGVAAMLLSFATHDSSIHWIRETAGNTPGDPTFPTEPPHPNKIATRKEVTPEEEDKYLKGDPSRWQAFWEWVNTTRKT